VLTLAAAGGLTLAAPVSGATITTASKPPLAPDPVSAWDLYEGKYSVKYLSTVRMWDCWDLDGPNSTPTLRRWTGDRWVIAARGVAARNVATCGKARTYKVTFTWKVSSRGTWNAAKGLRQLKLRESLGTEKYVYRLSVRG